MAQATVFVDDAVLGDLPPVCAKTGEPTTDQLRVRSAIGDRAGFGIAWLLLLAGPLGWLGLVVMAIARSGRTEEIVVRIPMHETAYQRLRATRRLENVGLALVLLTFPVLLLTLTIGNPTLQRFAVLAAAAGFVLGVVLLVVSSVQQRAAKVRVDLDASRRWVHLGDVHPAFAAACEAERGDRERQRA
jgi:hypothetical protein